MLASDATYRRPFRLRCGRLARNSLQQRLDLTHHAHHILVAHRGEQRQCDSLATDARGHRRVLLAIALSVVILEAGNTGIVHADADTAIGHGLLKPGPSHAMRREIDEHLEHMPAMAGIAAGGQYHRRKVAELLEIAAG